MRTPARCLALLALAGATLAFAPTRSAQADCSPGATFCAEAHIRIGPNRRQRVRHHPRPRVHHRSRVRHHVVVQPAPPPPDVVVVQRAARPSPPPPPRTQRVTVEHRTRTRIERPDPKVGLHGQLGGLIGRDLEMGGFTGGLRLRPTPHLGLDLGIGAYGGTDYNGLDRLEIPLTADLLMYVNPQHRVQFYFVAGAGVSFAHAEGINQHTGRYMELEASYLGGQAGAGIEWRINRHFGLNFDVRGFLRKRVDSDQPEFVEYDDGGLPTGRTTNTSAGGTANIGASVYF